MKANEAPEKLYYAPYGDIREDHPITGNDIEYIRADAFIEKACDAYCKVCGHYAHTTPTHICRPVCDYYKDFRERMKRK